MAENRVAAFLDQLRESQLLTQAQLDESRRTAKPGEDALPLAKELIYKGWLTAYQAKTLMQGKGGELAVGSYRLLDLLGEGGMGQVFKAHHVPMDRIVALKIIRKEALASPTAVQRFHQEIRAVAQLTHPNIVTAFDAGQVGDRHFFAMEYVEGVDLAKLVKESGVLPVADACEYIRQAASGLQHAHERGMVHRDIKPHNLLLSRSNSGAPGLKSGVIKVLDMGLARLQGPAEGAVNPLTRLGTVVGTPEYLAPEQAINPRAVDIRADLYSLGCTFYFLLTGQPPFRGEELTELLLKHQVDELPPLEKFRNDVPAVVQSVVRKLLAKKPEDRYQTPDELLAALPAVRKKAVPTASPVTAAAPPLPVAKLVPNGSARASRVINVGGARQRSPQKRLVVLALLGLPLLAALLVAAVALSSGEKTTQAVAHATSPVPFTPASAKKTESRPRETRHETPPTGRVPEGANPTGKWKWQTTFGDKQRDMWAELKLDGDKLTGVVIWREGGDPIPIEDAHFADGEVSFKFTRMGKGKQHVFKYKGKVMGDTIKGKYESDFTGGPRDWDPKRVNP
ncbi:MAG: serine/threonine protein kinase [Gemmataceae bacterium]|nr:serine/threonine protein kinase [Gemmataceae bacterium]